MPLHDLIPALLLAIHLTCLFHLSRASSAKRNRISSRFFTKTFGAFFTKNERTKGPRGNTELEADRSRNGTPNDADAQERELNETNARAHTHTYTHC